MTKGINVAGAYLVRPQAVSIIDDKDMAPMNLRPGGIVALLGTAKGGEPQHVHYIQSLEQARGIFQSGNLVEAVRLALNPSADTPGAALIACIRVEAATQAHTHLVDGAEEEVAVTSVDYGVHTNALAIYFDGTAGEVGVRSSSGAEVIKTLGGKAFTIQYTGAGSAAALTIDGDGIEVDVTGAATDNLSIPWGTYDTLAALVAAIDAHANYTCVQDHANSVTDPENLCDYVTAQDIKASAYSVPSWIYDLVDFFNNESGGLVSAVGQAHAKPDDTAPEWTYLTGGTTPAAVDDDYSDALALLEAEDVHLVVAYTDDATVQAEVQSHVETMSSITGKLERIAITGSSEDDTVALALADALGYNSPRVVYVYPGLKFLDTDTGELVVYPGYKVAAAVAGMLSGVDVGTALTHRYLHGKGIETMVSPTDLDSLLLGGVLPIEYVRGKGYRVVQSITTWCGDGNYVRREVSCRRAADYVARTVREALEDLLIGQKGGPHLMARAVSASESILRQLQSEDIIVGDESNPAFKNVVATLDGEVLNVSFEVNLVVPVNYIILRVSMHPYEGTLTA